MKDAAGHFETPVGYCYGPAKRMNISAHIDKLTRLQMYEMMTTDNVAH